MKTLLLVRHAKSSWDNFSVGDAERPLSERGKKNAPEMAKRLLKKKVAIDAFLSSPAKRALTTAKLFAKEYSLPSGDIIVIPELYLADITAFQHAIAAAPPEAGSIAVFSHNSGITEFANSLTNVRIDNMPTCAVFGVTIAVNSWTEFAAAPKEFYLFDFPKSGENGEN